MFLWRNKKNYLSIILNTPSYLELCKNRYFMCGCVYTFVGLVYDGEDWNPVN